VHADVVLSVSAFSSEGSIGLYHEPLALKENVSASIDYHVGPRRRRRRCGIPKHQDQQCLVGLLGKKRREEDFVDL
jgi:hypothetical protein